MTQYMNRKYRNKCSLHVADYLRGDISDPSWFSKTEGPSRCSKVEDPVRTEGSARFSQKKDPERYQCLGFLFTRGDQVDPQEFTDFWHMQWYRIELESDLKFGVLPSGLLVRCPGGEVRVVCNSELVPLEGLLGEVK